MTKDERIQGLIEANNRNTMKRRALASALRHAAKVLPAELEATRMLIEDILHENGPE